MAAKTLPCEYCGSKTRARSACPGCGKVVCQRCAEREGEFCCDVDKERDDGA